MKLDLTGGGVLALAGVATVLAIGLYAWSKRGAIAAAVGKVGDAVNPASSDNLVNRGVEAVGQAVTGDAAWTPGGALWDFWHNDEIAAWLNKPLAPRPTSGDFARADRAMDAAREAAPIYEPGHDFGGTFGYGSA